ncbi:hypothetical protein Poli38472_010034 [Pythium oligandrum]|uniref:RCC1-like domain-containing protein n=1 Tax=Pythium oligandrum TaxID=41045 RepID=A0A8K1C8Y8_PYTOL|nr:hypothetical protein Poli38472_010034 [Pythium oligandrum]|eukprot:TMW58475.1 hypothetical protein Poli38472_010034 [Pythium oligandrum]
MQNQANYDEVTALDLWESVKAQALTRVEMLLTVGEVDVNERNDLGETALHLAASSGYDAIVQVLLAHGADITLKDSESGWTPLHRSIYHERLSTTLLLLRHARVLYGRAFMKDYLYALRDFADQSAMELLSSITSDVKHGETQRGGMVYTFGKVDFQLGYHLPHVNVQSSPRIVELPITTQIVQISASKFHTVVLNDRGEVYVWGFGKGGRLGTGTEYDHVEPVRISALEEIPIAKVAAGENHTLALSRSGQVFSWGSNSFGQLGHNVKAITQESRLTPKRIDAFRGMVMVDVAASGSHSGAICRDDGALYTWGSNKKGQLGRKEGFGGDQPNPTPKRVDRLVLGHALSVIYEPHDSIRVEQVAMSDVHTCVILQCMRNGQSHGQVWQFGYGANVPSRINFKEKRRTQSQLLTETWIPRWKLQKNDIMAISCAPNHSIALSACGAVYTWGHNGDALSHQQATKKEKDFAPPGAPQRVVALDKYGPIVSICASQDHCAVVTRDGRLVSWGGGSQGVLGHGPGNSWQPKPKQVPGAKKVVAVAAGHQHTVVLVGPREPISSLDECAGTSPPKLRTLLEHRIAHFLDLSNVATVWKYANAYSQTTLEQYCMNYMRQNWDALLEMGGKECLDVLFDLMLPPSAKIQRSPPQLSLLMGADAEEKPAKSGKSAKNSRSTDAFDKTTPRKGSVSLESKQDSSTATVPASPMMRPQSVWANVPSPQIQPQSKPPVPSPLFKSLSAPPATPSPLLGPQNAPVSRKKSSKFVPLDTFFSEKVDEPKPTPPTTGSRDFFSPWKPSAPSTPAPTPTPLSQPIASVPRRKSSIGNPIPSSPQLQPVMSPALPPRKQVLCQDGSERAQVSTFSLDAFIKKSSRKKSRSDSMDKSKEVPMWGSTTNTPQPTTTKTFMEIQIEEEARAAAEAAAKARNGGFIRKSSTVNSWGLVQQQEHISLAELQKREEEERFLEEQRQILAQIERENQLRKKEEQRRARRDKTPQASSTSQTPGDKKSKQKKGKKDKINDEGRSQAPKTKTKQDQKEVSKRDSKPRPTRNEGEKQRVDETTSEPAKSKAKRDGKKRSKQPVVKPESLHAEAA